MFARLIGAGAAALVLAAPAPAAPIPGLFSTGTPGAGGADAHYTLVSAPAGVTTGPAMVVTTPAANFPFDAYWAKPGYNPTGAPASAWIAPIANASLTQPNGTYTYRTTFDLTGFIPATAAITGFVAADNAVDILLNGAKVAGFAASDRYTFTAANFASQAFSIAGGFLGGLNTLDFVVTNDVQATGNPTGLRVGLAGTAAPAPVLADPAAVPEPASLAALGLGVAGVAGYARRRLRTA